MVQKSSVPPFPPFLWDIPVNIFLVCFLAQMLGQCWPDCTGVQPPCWSSSPWTPPSLECSPQSGRWPFSPPRLYSLWASYALFPLLQDAADGVDDGPLPPPLPPPRSLDDHLRILLETRGETVAEVDCQAHSKICVCNIFPCLLAPFLLLHLACKDSEEGKESSFGKAADKWMGENFIFVLKIKKFPDCALTIHVQFVCHHLICKTNCYYWTLSFLSFKGENTLERQPDRGGWWSFLSFTLSYHQWQWLHQESFPNTSNSTISLQSMYDLCGRTPGGK